jgi:hypothetical protein
VHDVTRGELIGAQAQLQPAAQNVPLEPVRASSLASARLRTRPGSRPR